MEQKTERRTKVKEAIREMGNIHHPINIKTGTLQTAAGMEDRFDEQFKIIHGCAKEAKLSESCLGLIEKAKRAFDAIVCYMKYFFIIYKAFFEGLRLSVEQNSFFNEFVFTLCYLKMIWRQLLRKVKEDHKELLQNLEARIRDAP